MDVGCHPSPDLRALCLPLRLRFLEIFALLCLQGFLTPQGGSWRFTQAVTHLFVFVCPTSAEVKGVARGDNHGRDAVYGGVSRGDVVARSDPPVFWIHRIVYPCV